MRILRTVVVFLCCLYGGGILGSIVLYAGTIWYYGVPTFHDYRCAEVQAAFLAQAHPIAGVIGAAVGVLVFVRGKRRAKPSGANHHGTA
jgi:hypothetical protein